MEKQDKTKAATIVNVLPKSPEMHHLETKIV